MPASPCNIVRAVLRWFQKWVITCVSAGSISFFVVQLAIVLK